MDGFLESQRFVPMLYLVGMKKDLREQRFLERAERRTRTPASFPPFPLCCVCPADVSATLFLEACSLFSRLLTLTTRLLGTLGRLAQKGTWNALR